jgi:Tol biopolymer transport system component
VWIKELDHGPMSRLSLGGPVNYGPAWTADGRSVTFMTETSPGKRDLHVRRADGSAPAELLLASARAIMYASESRDGQWIVYQLGAVGATTGRDLYARRLHGDTTPVALVAGPALREESPRLSPDGRWLAYASNETGRSEVYVRPFPNASAARAQVSVIGGYEPLWSRNGRELFYTDEEGILFAARVETSPTFRVVARERLFDRRPFNFSDGGGSAYDIASDGRFIMARAGRGTGMQLVLVLNWFADLAPAAK